MNFATISKVSNLPPAITCALNTHCASAPNNLSPLVHAATSNSALHNILRGDAAIADGKNSMIFGQLAALATVQHLYSEFLIEL